MSSSMERRTGPVVAVRPMPDALTAAVLLGLFGGLVLAGVIVGIGVPVGPALGAWWNLVFAGLWLGGGAVLGALSWRATCLRFEPDHFVITRPTGLRGRIPWEHVRSLEVSTSTNEDGDVMTRWLTLRVLRHPDVPVPEMPSTLGEFRIWRRQNFRIVRLGVALPGAEPVDAHNRFGRMRLRTRLVVLHELESRGFTLPD
ncbi:MAG TPA: hypothetical protein VGL06_07350 [Pseudonocardiaceae bacterium]